MKISGHFFDALRPAGVSPVSPGVSGAAARASGSQRRRVLPPQIADGEGWPVWMLGGRPLPEWDETRAGFEQSADDEPWIA